MIIQPSSGCWIILITLPTPAPPAPPAEERAFDDTILDREEVDWNRYNLAKQAFITCNSDGEEGLTWDEISTCEEQFCGLLSVECPTEDDFAAFDINGDGILTWHEFMEVNLAIVGSDRDSFSAIEALELFGL